MTVSVLVLPMLLGLLVPQRTRPIHMSTRIGKGMDRVCLVELGSGCCHGSNSTKAAIRACNDAIEWNSVKVRNIIPGSYDAMILHVQLGVPSPETVDVEMVASCFPYGKLQPILVTRGGMLASSREGLPDDEPNAGLMTIACACVTVGYNAAEDQDALSDVVVRTAPPKQPMDASNGSPHEEPGQAEGLDKTPPDSYSSKMLARAADAASRWEDRVLTPYEAFAVVGDEDEIEIVDVRNAAQRRSERINGVGSVSVKGAISIPLDTMLDGTAQMPPTHLPLVLVCSRGTDSLVALAHIAGRYPRAVCVEGGITAWDAAALPTETV